MTVVHNVLFKLKDPTDIQRTAEMLRSMDGKIAALRSIDVGVDQLGTPRSYHISLTTKFDSWEDFETYRVDPIHAKVLEHMAQVTDQAAAVDYEI